MGLISITQLFICKSFLRELLHVEIQYNDRLLYVFIRILSKSTISQRQTQYTVLLPMCTYTHYSLELLVHRKTTHFYTVHSLINKHTHINTWKQYANTRRLANAVANKSVKNGKVICLFTLLSLPSLLPLSV